MRLLRAIELALLAALLATPVLSTLLANQPATGRPARKVAFLAGPSRYLHDFANLTYPADDVKALAAKFRENGFDEVVVLTDAPEGANPATRKNILDRLEKLVKGQSDPAKNIRKDDVVVVVFSGHGLELDVPDPAKPGEKHREAFFAPVDGRKGDPKSLVSLGHVVDEILSPCGGKNLLLVDACREIYDPNKGKGIGGRSMVVPRNTAILFSCDTGEESFESRKLEHGVFTHAVLEAMSEAKKSGDDLSWSDLVAGVEKQMRKDSVKREIPSGKTQTPVLAGVISATELFAAGSGDLARAEPKGEERSFEIATGVKMVFCWIPAGEAQLGSSKAEQDYITRTYHEGKRPEYLDEETETKRGIFKTKGFWLGKYAVTQGEWEAVMGSNPSYFDGKKDNKAKGLSTSRFPVEGVSWDMISKAGGFLEKLNQRGGVARVFGKDGRFVLPHEDQWEYACRGGKGNGRAFYFGDELNGTQAHCDGSIPYRSENGDYKGRPTEVGSYAAKYPHPWGLCDMHGNVWQWCENSYDNKNKVVRGGSWSRFAWVCRSASRSWYEPDSQVNFVGFRVCLPL